MRWCISAGLVSLTFCPFRINLISSYCLSLTHNGFLWGAWCFPHVAISFRSMQNRGLSRFFQDEYGMAERFGIHSESDFIDWKSVRNEPTYYTIFIEKNDIKVYVVNCKQCIRKFLTCSRIVKIPARYKNCHFVFKLVAIYTISLNAIYKVSQIIIF